MERIKSRKLDGKQNPEYYKQYYRENRERLAKQNKARYIRVRSNPELLKLARQKAAEATRKWRAKHPDKVKKSRKIIYNNRKIKALKIVGDSKCARCGCDEIDFLEFNHKNGDGCKDWKKSGGKAMMDRILTQKRKTDDLEILCRVCNALEFLERKNSKSAQNYRILWG